MDGANGSVKPRLSKSNVTHILLSPSCDTTWYGEASSTPVHQGRMGYPCMKGGMIVRQFICRFGLLLMLTLLAAGCSGSGGGSDNTTNAPPSLLGGGGGGDNITNAPPIVLDSFRLDDGSFVLQ